MSDEKKLNQHRWYEMPPVGVYPRYKRKMLTAKERSYATIAPFCQHPICVLMLLMLLDCNYWSWFIKVAKIYWRRLLTILGNICAGYADFFFQRRSTITAATIRSIACLIWIRLVQLYGECLEQQCAYKTLKCFLNVSKQEVRISRLLCLREAFIFRIKANNVNLICVCNASSNNTYAWKFSTYLAQ